MSGLQNQTKPKVYQTTMNNNEQISKEIIKQLSMLSLENQVEILANVLMFLGTDHMSAEENINPNNIAEIILLDRRSNGETVANALALQGLTMMLWLQQ